MVENKKLQNKGPIMGARHVQALLLFFCFTIQTIDRLKTVVAIFTMTGGIKTSSSFKEFNWNKTQKGYILSSFYWGVVLTQFIGSLLCRKFGAKLMIFISVFGYSVLSILTPYLVSSFGEWRMYIVITFLQGMFQGLSTANIYDHIAKWAPIEERIRLGAFAHSGIELGTILAMGVPGLIAQSSWGWPGISYVSGGISIAWCFLWALFADNSPIVSRFISSEEKQFILTSQRKNDEEHKEIPVPWRAIFTSVPFISLVIIESAQALGFKTIQNEIPSYLHGILHMDIKSNSLFSALPYLAMFVVTNLCLVLGDLVMQKNIMSLTILRKTISTISTWIPAVILVLLGFLDEKNKTLVIVLMTVSVGITGGKTIGSRLNIIDLSCNHAATLIGITRTACSAIFMITPLFVAAIVKDGSDRSEWQIVFVITAMALFVGNLQYIILGKTNAQPWNDENFALTNNISTITQEIEKNDIKEEANEDFVCYQFGREE